MYDSPYELNSPYRHSGTVTCKSFLPRLQRVGCALNEISVDKGGGKTTVCALRSEMFPAKTIQDCITMDVSSPKSDSDAGRLE
jgi:hypothetical protein